MVVDPQFALLAGLWCGIVALTMALVWPTSHCRYCNCKKTDL